MSIANIDSTKLAKPSDGFLERLPTGEMIFKPFPRERVLAPPVAQDEASDIPSAPPIASQVARNIPEVYVRGRFPSTAPEGAVHPVQTARIGYGISVASAGAGGASGLTRTVSAQEIALSKKVTPQRRVQPQRRFPSKRYTVFPILDQLRSHVARFRGQELPERGVGRRLGVARPPSWPPLTPTERARRHEAIFGNLLGQFLRGR